MNAFSTNEPACEQLGSTHLLWHGIFAFKVSATGARSDLMYGELPDDTLLTRSVEGLVLTEWKLANDAKSAKEGFNVARVQADRYSQGPLAGIEPGSVGIAGGAGGELPGHRDRRLLDRSAVRGERNEVCLIVRLA